VDAMKLVSRTLATMALAAVVFAGCGGDEDEPSAAAAPAGSEEAQLAEEAQKEGTLNFYTSADPVTAQKMADAFGDKYDLDVTFTRLTSGPIAARYAAEAQAGTFAADVVMIADEKFFANNLEKDWMLPMDEANVPNVADLDDKFQFDGSVGIGVSRLNGIVANTEAISEGDVPKSWEDLLDPQWKGRLITDDPRAIPVVMGQWQLLEETYGKEYLEQTAAQEVQFVPSLVTGVQSVAAGERDAAYGANLLHVNPLTTSAPDAPVKLTYLEGPDFGFTWNAGVSAKSKNPAAGRLFVNWLLTEEGQKAFNGPGNNSVLPSVTIPESPPLDADFVTLSADVPEAEAKEIVSALGLSG